MSAAEIKNFLHKVIVETEDVGILENMKNYFDLLNSKNSDWWEDLTSNQKKEIETAILQIENGNYSTHKDVRGRINELIKNKK